MQHVVDLLRLAASDLVASRRILLVILIFHAEVGRVDDLLARFPDDRSAMWLSGGALHHFRQKRKSQANEWLTRAFAEHPSVPPYLFERRAIPQRASSEEACEDIVCAIELTQLWASTTLRSASTASRVSPSNRDGVCSAYPSFFCLSVFATGGPR